MKWIDEFIRHEATGGLLLILAAALALVLSNSSLSSWYSATLHMPVGIHVGPLELDKSLYHWVNEGLMAIFFLLIGLEIKREVLEGHLSSLRQASLPIFGAAGGMLIPALIYVLINHAHATALQGWAIPTATDIAFSLGILSLLGSRVPTALKIFLMALAIIDDLGAIVIIALFYTSELSWISMALALTSLSALVLMNRLGVVRRSAYFLVALLLWLGVLKSGVHATLAGVALAFTIPLSTRGRQHRGFSPLKSLEHDLHPWVSFLILPLFAFVNAGVDMRPIALDQMGASVPLGILLGLFLGKQAGVFGFAWLAIRLGWARLPDGCRWLQLYGVSALTGIGFTMSLFITSLAFEDDAMFAYTDKLAVLAGSLLSGMLGYLVLRLGASGKTAGN